MTKPSDALTLEQHQILFTARMIILPPRALLERRFDDLEECPYGLTWEQLYEDIHRVPAHTYGEPEPVSYTESAADHARRLWLLTQKATLGDVYDAYSESHELRPGVEMPAPAQPSGLIQAYWAERGLHSFEEFKDFMHERFENLGEPPEGKTWAELRKEYSSCDLLRRKQTDTDPIDWISREVEEKFDGLFGKRKRN